MTSCRAIASLYAVLFAGLGVAAGALFLDARAEYTQLKAIEATNRRALADATARLARQTETLRRLREDRDYIEKTIRQRLNYARPGEVIFSFPE